MTIFDIIRTIMNNEDVLTACLTGKMGRGKTNAGMYLADMYMQEGYTECYYWNVNRLGLHRIVRDLKAMEYYQVRDDNYELGKICLFFDDFSFSAMRHSSVVDAFLQHITVIRHMIRARKYFIIVVQHYPFATLPFLRESHINIVMSLTYTEYSHYKRSFPPRYLKRFWHIYKKDVLQNKKGAALIDAMGYYEITRFPKVDNNIYNKIIDMSVPSPLSPTTRPPISTHEFRKLLREAGVKARNDTLHEAWRLVMKRLGYMVPEPEIIEEDG